MHKKWHRINPVSKKQREVNKKRQQVYAEIDETREQICSGCGCAQSLSHSHIIPRSRRKDLETDPKNILFDCLSLGEKKGCHDIWEHGTYEEKQKLLNFEERMNYIADVDPNYYNLLINKWTA